MSPEIQGKIQTFLFHLSNDEYSKADKEFKSLVEKKVQDVYDKEYQTISNNFNQNMKNKKNQ